MHVNRKKFKRYGSLEHCHMKQENKTYKLKRPIPAHSWGNVISIFLTSYYASREMSPQAFP